MQDDMSRATRQDGVACNVCKDRWPKSRQQHSDEDCYAVMYRKAPEAPLYPEDHVSVS